MTTGSIEITDSDALSCVLGYYLDDINSFKTQYQTSSSNENIFYISTVPKSVGDLGYPALRNNNLQILPALPNLITKKEGDEKLCNLGIFKKFKDNQLFFNQVTPSIKLYKIFKTNNGLVELDIPFDIVAGQKYFQTPEKNNNFVEKLLEGGSGNAVGIANFAWKSEGKNEGNNTIFTVDFKIILQSISELETVRNRDEQNKIQVTLLDLLYPSTKSGKFKTDPAAFEPEEMFIKADVGWNMPFGSEQYEKFFKTSLYLHLYKHNFTFHDSGRVELSLTYIGNIETVFKDKTKYDIFMSEEMRKVSELKTVLEQIISTPKTDLTTLQKLILEADSIIGNINIAKQKIKLFDSGKERGNGGNAGMGPAAGRQRGFRGYVKESQQGPEEAKEKLEFINKEIIGKQKANFFNKILKSLLDQKRIFTFKIEKEDFQKFKNLISAQNINSLTLQSIKKTSEQLNKKTLSRGIPENKPDLEEGIEEDEQSNRYIIDYEEIYDQLNDPTTLGFGSDKFVNFVYLDDLIQTVIKEASFTDKDINLFFGPYSYRNYKNIAKINENQKTRPLQKTYINNQPKYYKIVEVEKKAGNIGHIPISLDVLINWYNEEVIKSDETGYSFFEFLKKCFNTLIPQSIGSKNAPNAPEQNVLTTNLMFNTTKESFEKIINKKTILDYETANKYYNNRTSPLNTDKTFKNIFYLSSNEDDMSIFKGNEQEDCELEVLHLHINDIKNIIKKANFKRDDNQKLETANLLAANSTEGNKIIRQVYHCDLEMFGNNFFEPGNLIYIKPNYPGVNLSMDILFKIGLGGYYRVIRTENDIGVGSFTTRVNCRWEMFGGGLTDLDIIDESGIKQEDILYKID